jgi:hypothetical protein
MNAYRVKLNDRKNTRTIWAPDPRAAIVIGSALAALALAYFDVLI